MRGSASRPPRSPAESARSPRTCRRGDAPARRHVRELQDVARQLHEAHDRDDDDEPQRVKVGREKIHLRPKPGLKQSLSAFDRLTTADTWGGLISVDAEDTVAALKRINDDECKIEAFRPSAERGIEETLRLTVELG